MRGRWLLGVIGMLLVMGTVGCSESGVIETQATEAIPSLVEGLQSDDPSERADAAKALGARGDAEAVPALIEALQDEDASVRLNSIEALGAIGDERAVEPLATIVENPGPTTGGDEREAAAEILGELGDPEAVPALVQYSTESYETVKAALVAIGKPAVKPLVEALKLKSDTRRQVAAEVLGAIGDTRAVKPLMTYARRGSDASHVAAAALAAIGKPAVKPLMTALDGALGGDDTWAAAAAIAALGEIGDVRAVPALQTAMQADVVVTVWQAASDALAHLYRKDVPKLLAMLKSADTVRIYWGLIGLGKSSTVDELIAALRSYGGEVMAEDYLNCGNSKLENAGHDWADSHGYTITTLPGFGGDPWGSKGD